MQKMKKLLNNGLEIPAIGLGTYKSTPEQLQTAIPHAINCGYRLFDTATVYRNEEAVGKYLREAMKINNLNREDIFVTSKLAPADQGYQKAIKAVEESVRKLGFDYIDLYLIHWPGTAKLDPSDPLNFINRKDSWRALEECVEKGLIKSIGVSNYKLNHLKEMEEYARISPAVNQFELHPAYVEDEVIDYCEQRRIFVQSYASLGEDLSKKYSCSVPQLLLKWPLQRGWGIIPKSVNLGRITENVSLNHFEIETKDLALLNNFHKIFSCKKCWNSEKVL